MSAKNLSSPPNTAPDSLADHARDFLTDFDAAFHVFGNVNGNAKHPLAKGGIATGTRDLAELERRCLNPKATGYCIYPGDFIVVDIDVGDDKDGRAALADLAAKHGEKIPATALVASPRGNGSGHLYFNIPEGELIPSSNGKIAPGVDVRGNDGAYWVAGPGSRTDKGEYQWERGPEHIIDAPQWLLDAAKAARPRARDRAAPKALPPCVEWDDPRNIERFVAWLRSDAKPSIEGQGGNDTLAATGAMGSSLALYEETTIQLMAEHWNDRCEPPWDHDDLEYYGGSGYRSAESAGNMATKNYAPLFLVASNGEQVAPAAPGPDARYQELKRHFDGVLAGSGDRARSARRFRDAADAPPPQWIIPGWLSQHATWLLYGESESFKTYITLNMLLCVATGTPWGMRDGFEGYAVGPPRPALLLAGESYSGVIQRVHAAIAGGGFDRALVEENLILIPDVYSLNYADGLARIADEIEALETRPAIIAVDTLNLALDGNEDSSDEIKRALRGLRALAVMFGAAGLAIDHVGHGDKTRPRGSSAKKANADGMILCERLGDSRQVILTQHKNRDDDKSKYRAAFLGEAVEIGTDPAAGTPITDLAFRATELPSPGGKARSDAIVEELTFHTIERAVEKVLAANPIKDWSDSALATAVECDTNVTVRAQSLRKKWLPALRAEISAVRQYYDPMKNRWRHQEAP